MTWIYLAGAAQAAQAATLNFAVNNNVIYRRARNRNGALIPNVRHLQPGDRILLAYRQPPGPRLVHLCARIAPVANPVPGTQVIEQIGLPFAQQLFNAGYKPAAPGIAEVIHLKDVQRCQFQLQGSYHGRHAIWKLAPQDAGFVQLCPACA